MSEESSVTVYFLDSSAIVKRYALEAGTNWVNTICEPGTGNITAISHIGLAEVAAALAAKHRAGTLSAHDYQQTMTDFISDAHLQYTAVIVDALLVDLAVDLTRRQNCAAVMQFSLRLLSPLIPA